MLRRLFKEESGVALGLAVILIVIVGVMGAGLLVFVRNDLQAVVEVNQGQEAFETTEAGVQAAKRQLLSDARAESYDGDNSSDSSWSYDPDDENDGGKRLKYEGREVDVKIQHLTPLGEGSCGVDDESDPNCAPENTSDEGDNRSFFKVEALGKSGNGGARRKVEAIYNTYELGVPKAYYTPNNVTITGKANIDNVSVFSGGDVDINNNAEITGEDKAYGNWQNEYNDEPRSTSAAGVGALGSISNKVKNRDFDSGTIPPFTSDPSNGQMTFPFDVDSQSEQADQARIDFLREEAKNDGVHYTSTGGKVDIGSDFDWPADADENTVVFVEYTGDGNNQADWEVGDDSDPPAEGILVVSGGDFNIAQNKACFKGVAVVRGGEYEEGDSKNAGGGTCINGFVNASGEIELAGNVEPFASEEVLDRPGFYGVEQWSWRELYE